MDAAREPGDRRAPRVRVRRRSQVRDEFWSGRGWRSAETVLKATRRRASMPQARAVVAELPGRLSRASSRAIRSRTASRRCCSPTTSRSTPARASCTPRPVTAPTTTASARRTASTRSRRSTKRRASPTKCAPSGVACTSSRPTRTSSQFLRETGVLANREGAKVDAQLPALLALQEPDHLPRHDPVVHRARHADEHARRRPDAAPTRARRGRRHRGGRDLEHSECRAVGSRPGAAIASTA